MKYGLIAILMTPITIGFCILMAVLVTIVCCQHLIKECIMTKVYPWTLYKEIFISTIRG